MVNQALPNPTARSAPLPTGSEAATDFVPSAELGDQVGGLAREQAEIDRRKAEELARLQEIQSAD